ncbi:hypothetical protein QUA20_29025 [Microcoleus sp. Pol7_A1]|uniref:hypothetical protein n=1 Tax=Microcoleus sp. Pol7_A1 TaxID=2818893 RepID=UPI002FD60BF9
MIEWKLVLVPMLPAVVVLQWAIKRTVVELSQRDIDASNADYGVNHRLGIGGCDGPDGWEGRDGPEGREGWEGWEGRDGPEGRDGCEKERMLLDHRTRTLAPGVICTISTSGDLLFFGSQR